MRKAPLCSVLLLLLLAATGCSRYYWSKPDATAEQFTKDSRACVQQAATTVPAGAASLDAVEQYYRACLTSLGYLRDKQLDPPPPGSYRGIENTEDFNAAVQVAAQAPRQNFEQQLAQLDEMKTRGRITDDEYATMRRRLVEGVTPGALTPAPPPSVGDGTAPADRPVVRARRRDPRHPGDARRLEWDWEHVTDRVTARASGAGTAAERQVSLVGRVTGSGFGGSLQPFSFSLTLDGPVLRGSATGPNNLPRRVEFRRDRP